MTVPPPSADDRTRRLARFVAVLATTHARTLVIFLALFAVWCALPERSAARALYCLACGLLAVAAMFFATALWLVKKCPARAVAVSPDEPFTVRARRRAGNLLARVRKGCDARLRQWHNDVGATAAPLALVHASFRGGSVLTLALLLSLGFVVVSGFILAYQHGLLPVKGLAANPKASAAAREAVAMLDSSRRIDLTLHRAGTLGLWALLALHIGWSSMF
jgi:hypothetical protein